VDSAVLGRVLSIFYFFYFGGYSLGSFLMGWIAGKFGSALTVGGNGVAALLVGIIVFFMRDRILELTAHVKS